MGPGRNGELQRWKSPVHHRDYHPARVPAPSREEQHPKIRVFGPLTKFQDSNENRTKRTNTSPLLARLTRLNKRGDRWLTFASRESLRFSKLCDVQPLDLYTLFLQEPRPSLRHLTVRPTWLCFFCASRLVDDRGRDIR